MIQFHRDSAFDKPLKRTIGHGVHGESEISECFLVANNIKCGDYNGWYEAWSHLAAHLEREAHAEEQQNSTISTGQKLLRASNYYRTAYFFLEENPEDKRIEDCTGGHCQPLAEFSTQELIFDWLDAILKS